MMNNINALISKGNGKLDKFQMLGTNTTNNKFCFDRWMIAKEKNKKAGKVVDICGVCYSQKSLRGYRKATATALDRNVFLAEKLLDDNEVKQFFFLQSHFRFQHHGDLITELCDNEGNTIRKFAKFTMIENFCRIAEYNPHCTFALWTKRKDIISKHFAKRQKPVNLILIYSNLNIDSITETPPKGFDKVFNNVSKSYEIDRQNCTGQKCIDCMRCYKFSDLPQNNVIIEAVK